MQQRTLGRTGRDVAIGVDIPRYLQHVHTTYLPLVEQYHAR